MLKICSFIITLLVIVFVIISFQKRQWVDNSRLIFYKLNPLVLTTLDPVTNELLNISIPDNFEVDSVGGRGTWLVSKIGQAGTTSWITKSLEWHLGIANIYDFENLNIWDKFRYYYHQKSSVTKNINLTETGLVILEKTADGIEVYRLTPHWYLKGQDWFAASEIVKQGLSVTLVNTTSITGMGAKSARLIESMGIRVKQLNSSIDNLSKCRIYTSNKTFKSSGFRHINRVFNCEEKIDESEGADIRIELGTDIAKLLFG